jgi:predicted AlkP superfamily pyrophosphatase or phosphodiesterase
MDRAGMAAWLEREFQPNLLLLHIAETDGTAHEYGPDSPEALAAVERADAAIARVVDSVKAAGAEASTDVVLVSDHGFVALAQQLQPNAAFRKRGCSTSTAGAR